VASGRFFYHSFPRRGTRDDAKALAILRSLIDIGFVLTPEQTVWKERLAGGGFSNPDYVKQIRICFTELSPPELQAHSESFGQFALEFEILTLRRLGALPVIYLPADSGEENSGEAAAAASVVRMSQLTRVLDRLIGLKTFLQDNPRVPLVSIQNGSGLTVAVPAEALANTLASIEGGVRPLEELQASLRILTSFFYPTENLQYNDTLDYYRQREWRIAAGLLIGGQPTTRPLHDSEKAAMIAIDREFFESELRFRNLKHRRIDLCHVMPSFLGKAVIAYARRIIVPRRSLDMVHSIMRTVTQAPQVVTLEELSS